MSSEEFTDASREHGCDAGSGHGARDRRPAAGRGRRALVRLYPLGLQNRSSPLRLRPLRLLLPPARLLPLLQLGVLAAATHLAQAESGLPDPALLPGLGLPEAVLQAPRLAPLPPWRPPPSSLVGRAPAACVAAGAIRHIRVQSVLYRRQRGRG